MKRALFCVIATVISVWRILVYDLPAVEVSSAQDAPAEMTLEQLTGATGDADDTEDTDTTEPDETVDDTTETTAVAQIDPGATETTTTTTVATTATTAAGTTPTTPKPTTTAKPTTTTAKPTTTVAPKRTVEGSSVDSGFGAVKVIITVQGTKIVGVTGTEAATDATSASISKGAIPKLQASTLQTQSATFDNVSGATYTSKAWKTSLAAAIASAGL